MGPWTRDGDMLLIATGRLPVVQELGLERAGVRYTPEGIEVDAHLRTSARNIYAAGDVLGGAQYSHLAGWQGFQATRNALLPGNAPGTPRAMPRVTFTSPEVARVGLNEQQARRNTGIGCGLEQWPSRGLTVQSARTTLAAS